MLFRYDKPSLVGEAQFCWRTLQKSKIDELRCLIDAFILSAKTDLQRKAKVNNAKSISSRWILSQNLLYEAINRDILAQGGIVSTSYFKHF